MLILPEHNRPYIISSLDSPVVPKFYWVFNGPALDFILSPILYLEETCGPAVEVVIGGFRFQVPASWNILVCDEESSMVDMVPIKSCSTDVFQAFVLSSNSNRFQTADVFVTDYITDTKIVHPMVQKGNAMCHPIGPAQNDEENILSVIMGPHDLYQKYLAGVAPRQLLY